MLYERTALSMKPDELARLEIAAVGATPIVITKSAPEPIRFQNRDGAAIESFLKRKTA